MMADVRDSNTIGVAKEQLRTISARIDSILAVLLRGCLHTKMGWPIRLDGYAYRVCSGCGIKRLFDEDTLKCYGDYGYDLPQLAAEWRSRRESEYRHGLAGTLVPDAVPPATGLGTRSGA